MPAAQTLWRRFVKIMFRVSMEEYWTICPRENVARKENKFKMRQLHGAEQGVLR